MHLAIFSRYSTGVPNWDPDDGLHTRRRTNVKPIEGIGRTMAEVTSELYYLEGFINDCNRPVNFGEIEIDCHEELVGWIEDVFPNFDGRLPNKKKFYPHESAKGLVQVN